MSGPSAEDLGTILSTAIRAGVENEPRTLQSRDGVIGASDLGFCRQKAALTMRGVQPTDSSPIWAAAVGTAVHNHVEGFLRAAFPNWIIEGRKVTAVYPNGAQVPGTPDIVIPEWNMVIDLKTVDGLAKVRKEGPSQNHRFQRHDYCLGAIQEGVLDPSRPVYVVNVYLDRSGKEMDPYVCMEEFDPTLTDEVSTWIDDVIYAVRHSEDAARDIPAPVCERICEFFTACRGGLPMEESDVIADEELVRAARIYRENGLKIKTLMEEREAYREVLIGVNGIAEGLQVRWTHFPATTQAATEKSAYDRLDVRPVRSR